MVLDEPQRPRPRAALVSLIDVIFILIVFIMLASTFDHLETIRLTSGGTSLSPAEIEPLVLDLGRDGELRPGPDAGSVEQAVASAVGGNRPVVVRVGEGAPLQAGIDALDRLRQAGAVSVSLQPAAAP